MKKVEINYVLWLRSELRKINKIPFEEIKWMKNGVSAKYCEEDHTDWVFMGLNNTSFPETVRCT